MPMSAFVADEEFRASYINAPPAATDGGGRARCSVGVSIGWLAMMAMGCGGDVVGPEGNATDELNLDGGASTSTQALTATGEAQACAAWQSARDR